MPTDTGGHDPERCAGEHPLLLALLSEVLRPGDVFIDIGANTGLAWHVLPDWRPPDNSQAAYMAKTGYQIPAAFGPHQTGQRLRTVQRCLSLAITTTAV